jgi:tetrahydromethanopterin S-methyltransferase subunit G
MNEIGILTGILIGLFIGGFVALVVVYLEERKK